MTTEIIPREKCRVCKIYLAKGCLNDICLECSKKNVIEPKWGGEQFGKPKIDELK